MRSLIGVRLPNNFLRPYGADSLIDFWRRWHITLSFWLRDYLYIPLGGNRDGRLRTYVNMIITMTLGGLWHGASWTFVIWGVLHGVGVAFVHLFRDFLRRAGFKSEPRWWNVVGLVLTFHFVTLLWVFFRAPTLDKARAMLAAAFAGGGWNTAGDMVKAQSGAVLLLGRVLGAARLRRSPDDQARDPPDPAGNRLAADRPVVGAGHDAQPRQLHEIHLFRFLIGGRLKFADCCGHELRHFHVAEGRLVAHRAVGLDLIVLAQVVRISVIDRAQHWELVDGLDSEAACACRRFPARLRTNPARRAAC